MIVDASVVLSAFFPDESQPQAQALIADHVAGRVALKAPALLAYEVSNAVWQAERRGRLSSEQAGQIVQALAGLDLRLEPQGWGESLPLARQLGLSAYDAAYLALAQASADEFITADQRLYRAARPGLPWVRWLGDYAGGVGG